MKMIVGLGNPGDEYAYTRHNVGFMVADELARRHAVTSWRNKHDALLAEIGRGEDKVILIKPQTYMNLSGTAVGAVARWYKIAPADIIVIMDDMDLAVGRLRLRDKGTSGGHRGLESILVQLGTEGFSRVRVGIGHPLPEHPVVDFVLHRFTADEQQMMDKSLALAADAAEFLLTHSLAEAMNRYNR